MTCTANPVTHGSDSTCTANANTGYTFSTFSGDCSGATCTLSSVTAAKSVTATFTQNTYTAQSPSAPGSNIVTTISGVAPGCGFATAQYQAVATPPPGMTFPHGVLAFTTTACGTGTTVNLSITYPQSLPQGAKFYKFGPEPGNTTPHWFELTPTNSNLSINGATVNYSITDNGAGDSNLADGIITDPAGYAVPGMADAAAIPTLSEWGVILLSGLMALFGIAQTRRRRL